MSSSETSGAADAHMPQRRVRKRLLNVIYATRHEPSNVIGSEWQRAVSRHWTHRSPVAADWHEQNRRASSEDTVSHIKRSRAGCRGSVIGRLMCVAVLPPDVRHMV